MRPQRAARRRSVEWVGGQVAPEAVRELFAAAGRLQHAAPWRIAGDGQLVRLDVPEQAIDGAAISIIGGPGESLGFLVFPSRHAFDTFVDASERAMRRRRRADRPDLGTGFLSLSFESSRTVPRAMRDEVARFGWPLESDDAYPLVQRPERDGLLRPLTAADVRLATACADALAAFVPLHAALFRGTSFEPVSESYTGPTGLTVRLTAPFGSFALFGDDTEAPSVAPRSAGHVGRNDPCPCGSGKKYKRCHLGRDAAPSRVPTATGGSATAPPETAAIHALDARVTTEMAAHLAGAFGVKRIAELVAGPDAAAEQLWLPWSLYHRRIDGRTPAEHFLAARAGSLTAQERAWLDAQARSWLGLWEVERVQPGAWLDLHDLLTGERRRVIDASASRTATLRDAVLGLIVDHAGVSVMCGMHPQPLPPLQAAEVAQRFRARLRRGRAAPIDRLREERLGRELIARWEEEIAALVERSRTPPRLVNNDGDELVFVNERYDFDPALRGEIEARLAALLGVVAPEAPDDRTYVFHRTAARGEPEPGDLVVGTAQVAEGHLAIETNSVRRADALRRRIERALGELVRHRRRRRRDARRMAERIWERRATGETRRSNIAATREAQRELRESPEAQRLLREMKDRHYATWPDEPLPALAGKTARQAVRTQAGRARVDALLKQIERGEAMLPAGERFDVTPLRRELGLSDLRAR